MQPAQPHILPPGQTTDPLTQIDHAYQAQKKQLHQQTMNTIKLLNRQDPLIQDKIATIWAEHAEKLGELDGDRRERKLQMQADQRAYYQQVMDRETTRALTQAGLDPVAHKDAFVDQVAVLNFRQPGWDAGMSQSQTYDYVVEQLKTGGRVAPSTTTEKLTPYQQHQALRQGAMGALKAGARLDPAKPQKKKPPEEKDVSFHQQLRAAKKARTVTEEQAMRLKIR
jgi:biopolymer transport protein ExbD